MKKLLVFVFVFFAIISLVSSLCEEGQININEASLEELDVLGGIGPARGQAIIDSRPFGSIDELINVYGIGPVTLEKIKNQGLACVEEETEESDRFVEVSVVVEEAPEPEKKDEEIEMIILTTQTIKSPENNENKSNYALYGFVGFCFLLGILFMLRRKKYKNEFR